MTTAKIVFYTLMYPSTSLYQAQCDPVGQTVARYPGIIAIPPVSCHFSDCRFPPEVSLQPFVTIVSACAPSPGLTRRWDLVHVKAGKLGNVIGVIYVDADIALSGIWPLSIPRGRKQLRAVKKPGN